MARAERNRLREIANADAASATAATVQTSRWQRMRAALNGVNAEVGELQKSLGIIGRVGGIAAALSAAVVGAYQLGRTLREYVVNVLETGTQKAQNFKDTLDLSNVPESLGKVRGELDQVNAKLEAAASGSFGGFLSLLVGDTTTKLQEQRTELERLVVSLNKTKKAQDDYNKSLAQQREYERQILQLQQQIQSANQASFGRIEASVEKIGQYVELMSRTIRRNG
jgi:ABC-type antimicrobial peptide transport system permease subunit